MDNEPATVPVPSPPRRGTSAVVVLAAALVGLAILKPWTFGAPGSAAGPTAGVRASPVAVASVIVPGASGAAAAPSPAIWDPNAIACMSSEGDRVLALLRAPGLEVRTWLTLDDPSLADPLDPAVVPLRLPSSHVIGLGVCARRLVQTSALGSAAQILRVEAVTDGGSPRLTDLGLPVVITGQLGIPTLGVLYGPPATLAPPGPRSEASPSPLPVTHAQSWPTWPAGAYAIAFRFPGDPPTLVRWVRLDILPAVGTYG
ncbi:MAG TPA: hypothetical protein VJ506_09885 [Candidatus Limnocylindrales bacterium]|nr:hypothetical protein [Candidatus Limnocylindrales bacterium]